MNVEALRSRITVLDPQDRRHEGQVRYVMVDTSKMSSLQGISVALTSRA